MDKITEKLLQELSEMTPEKEQAEWDELKEYNFGPTLDEYLTYFRPKDMTKSELIKTIKDFPDDAEVVTVMMYARFLSKNKREDIVEISYDKERNEIVIV